MTFLRFGLLIVCLLTIVARGAAAQKPPRLVVIVSFDQYRGDYPTLFSRFVGKRGFARMQKQGASFTKCYYEHANNITGPGHASLLTGCYPARTGIVGNDFCDLRTGSCSYCADDDKGLKSAEQLEVPTIGDLLRQKNTASRVVGISLKDRAGILMSGKSATTCVWYDMNTHRWTTSSYYPTPQWLPTLNRTIRSSKYAGRSWTTRIPQSLNPAYDSVDAEGAYPGGNTTFPHQVLDAGHPKFEASVVLSPFGIDMVFDAASIALTKEELGKDKWPDVLCIGVSSSDYVGHVFGPDSREVQELYAHADKRIEKLIDQLDAGIGRANYILVITSDHGVAPVPEVIRNISQQQGAFIDAGRIRESEIKAIVDSVLGAKFGKPPTASYVREISEPSIYLQDSAIAHLNRAAVLEVVVAALKRHPGLGIVATRDTLALGDCPEGADEATCRYVLNSFHASRSGDIVIYPKRYWIIGGNTATHGTPHDYDRYVPLMMLGGGMRQQNSDAPVAPVDIAPTLALRLGLVIGPIDGKPLPMK